MFQKIIGIDPSGDSCGMVVIDNGHILLAANYSKEQFYNKVTNYLLDSKIIVVIEDIKPYSLRLMPQVIDTCKFIGEALFRLKTMCGANVELRSRNEVKKWIFDTFPDVCLPIIENKIAKKGYISASTGEARKPSFVFVDDRIMTECMKVLYKIEKPKSGKGYEYGLKTHSWQSLALATYFYYSQGIKIPQIQV